MLFRKLALPLLFFLAFAHPVFADDNSDAREALRSGRYDAVLSLTERVAATEPDSAINWYRMSIAAARTGKFPLAAMALSNARLHDSTLSFASTPARVSALQEQIDRGEGVKSTPEQLRQDMLEVFQEELATAVDLQTPAKSGLDLESNANNQLIVDRLDQLALQLKGVRADVGDGRDWWVAAASPWMIGFLVLCLLIGFGLAAFIDRRARTIRSARMANLARMPLAEMLAFNRDHTELLRQRLLHHGKQDTALMQAMQRYLPSVELEAGRSQVGLAEYSKGCLMIDDTVPMEPAQRVLGKDSPQDVHSAALSRLLGGDRTVQKRRAA